MPPHRLRFLSPSARPALAVDVRGGPLPVPVQEAIVRVWLHAIDGDGRTRSESRRLVRHVASELDLPTHEARTRVEDALRRATPLHALRRALIPEQRMLLLASTYELARTNGRLELFDRLSAPLLARWLELSPGELAAARVLPEPTRPLLRLPRWRAA